jgi:hypothetical protein
MKNVNRLLNLALVEWKLQLRSGLFWAWLAIVMLYSLGMAIGGSPKTSSLVTDWLNSRENSLSWMSMGLIFLVPWSLARDHRTANIVWSTPITGNIYAGGKLLGVYLTALTVGGVEIVSQLTIRTGFWHWLIFEKADMILLSLWGWTVGILFISTIFFFLTVLARGQFFLACAYNILYFLLTMSARDVANPFDPYSFDYFLSDLIGYGPETRLFSAHHALYLSLTITLVFLSISIFSRIEKRSVVSKWVQIALLAGFTLSLAGVGYFSDRFIKARLNVVSPTAVGLKNASEFNAENIKSVQISARFDPSLGSVTGEAQILTAAAGNVTLYIPAGLTLIHVTDCKENLVSAAYQNDEWVIVSAPSQAVCLGFEGNWRTYRNWYTRRDSYTAEEYFMNTGGYIGQGYVYLLPGFRWYPTPIGTAEQHAKYSIEISLPDGYQSFVSGTPEITNSDGWKNYRWEHDYDAPIFTFASGQYTEILLPDGDILWVAPEHEFVGPQPAFFYLDFLKKTERLLGISATPRTIVETPLLRWPIASKNWVLLPERYISERMFPQLKSLYEITIEFDGTEKAFLFEAFRVTYGWIQGQIYSDSAFLPISVDDFLFSNGNNYEPFQESLAFYLSMQLTDQEFNTDRLNQTIQQRTQFFNEHPRGGPTTPTFLSFDDTVPNGYTNSLKFNDILVALGQLENQIGREQVNMTIRKLLETDYGHPVSIQDWLNIIDSTVGKDARQKFENTIYPSTSTQ